MSKRTGIEWAHHTFNAWWGCSKVSEACASCYAETFAERFPKTRGLWGPDAPRKIASEATWREPLKWNEEARSAGERRRVFVNSMSDVFEDRRDLDAPRARLWNLIGECPDLDWLLLTKRPEKVFELVPDWWNKFRSSSTGPGFVGLWPGNVWVGTTVENQKRAQERIPYLLRVPARVLFLSCEPLLEALDLRGWLVRDGAWWCLRCSGTIELGEEARTDLVPTRETRAVCPACGTELEGRQDWHARATRIGWVIAGGESGAEARPSSPEWFQGLRRDCKEGGVPFFLKQWGEWVPIVECYPPEGKTDKDGFKDGCEIDVPFEVSQFDGYDKIAIEPTGCVAQHEWADGTSRCDYQPRAGSWWMARVGKKAAERLRRIKPEARAVPS